MKKYKENSTKKIVKVVGDGSAFTPTFFYDPTNAREYRRLVGGIGFQFGTQSHFFVIIGEDSNIIDRLGKRNHYVLHEGVNPDLDSFLKDVQDVQHLYNVQHWYSDLSDLLYCHLLDEYNTKSNKKRILVHDAPFSGKVGNIKLYNQMLRSRLVRGKKSLFFGDSILPNSILKIGSEDMEKKTAREFVPFSALACAVASLEQPYIMDSEIDHQHETYINRKTVKGL